MKNSVQYQTSFFYDDIVKIYLHQTFEVNVFDHFMDYLVFISILNQPKTMKKLLLFCILLASITAHAQTLIKGQVIDQKTKETLAGISVYINNSTIGTITDTDGKFVLNVPFSGKVEVVFSHVIYQKKTMLVETARNENLQIALLAQDNTLNEVVIRASKNKDDNFKKWGDLFTKVLMGNDLHFANNCKIKNQKALVFYFDKQANELSVYARSPLIIENSITNYRIKMDLDNFKYAFGTDVLQFNYSAFFEEIPYNNEKEASVRSWRYSAYFGSQMHFMRAVFNNNLTNSGFTLYNYRSIRNKEKERVNAIVQGKIGERFVIKNNPNYDLKVLFPSRDTADYYQLVLKQNDVLAYDTTRVSLRKLAILERVLGTVKFNFKDTLMINYQMFLDNGNKFISPKNKENWRTQAGSSKYKGNNTFMYFVEEGGINIQSNGYYPEFKLFIYGDMSERRISQLLPWDYDPDKP